MDPIEALEVKLAAATISADQREKWRKQGVSMPDGSFPIPNVAFLKRAIQSFGRGSGDKGEIKAHIVARAKALGATNLLPEGWT